VGVPPPAQEGEGVGVATGRPMGVFWGGKWGMAEAKSSMQASPALSCKACSHRMRALSQIVLPNTI